MNSGAEVIEVEVVGRKDSFSLKESQDETPNPTPTTRGG